MNAKLRQIEVDEETAALLEARAGARGLSVPELIAEMTTLATSQETLSADEIVELDRRWAEIEAGEATVSNEDVVRWLRTWGSPTFKSWHGR
jgi:hypothetical protein